MRITLIIFVFYYCQTFFPALFGQSFLAPTDGPFGISVHSVAANAGGEVFVCSSQGDLFRSTDKGDTWAPADAGFNFIPGGVGGFLTDLSGNTYLTTYNALLRYDAAAAAWQATALPSLSGGSKCTAINPQGQIFVGEYGGKIFRSTDQGASFQQVATGLSLITTHCLAAFNDAHNLFYRRNSDETGQLYHFSTDGTKQLALSFLGVPQYLDYDPYTGTAFMASDTRMYRSKDGGLSWEEITPTQPNLGIILQMGFLPTGQSWIVNQQSKIFYSNNEGDTWEVLNDFDFGSEQVYTTPDGMIYLANNSYCSTNVFARSADGGNTWGVLDINFRHPTTRDFIADQSGQWYASTCFKGVLRSGDAGKSWAQARVGPQGPVLMKIAAGGNGVLFGAGEDKALYCSLNDGLLWNTVTPPGFSGFPGYLSLSVAPDGTLYCVGTLNFYRSSDFGAHWQVFSGQEIISTLPAQFFYHPNGHIYVFQSGYVFRSDDHGEHWARLFDDFDVIDAFHLDPGGGIWFYGKHFNPTIEGMYMSKDEGASTTVEELLDYRVRAITSNAAGNVFAASKSNALYRRENATSPWDSLGGITNSGALITGLYVDSEQYLYAYFDNDVVYKSQATTATVNIIRGQELRVFPNPFDAATTFEVVSPDAGTEPFVLSISDPLGHMVRQEIFQGPQIHLHRRDMHDGLYFFRIKAKDRLVGSGKILLRAN